jgi:hypothetical protein
MVTSTVAFLLLKGFFKMDVVTYANVLCNYESYGVDLPDVQRKYLVLWVLEREFPEVQDNMRYYAMRQALGGEGGCSNTPQFFAKCVCCGGEVSEVVCDHCRGGGL